MDTTGPFTRREWLAGTLTLLTAGCASRRIQDRADEIETVSGPVAAGRLGVTLMHEHVLVDFIGAAQVSPSRYDADAVFTAVLPHLQQVRRLGCETLVECTPAYLGRDPRLLKRLSQASGLTILSNRGYYGSANATTLPAHAHRATAEQRAARWEREYARATDEDSEAEQESQHGAAIVSGEVGDRGSGIGLRKACSKRAIICG